MICQYKIPLTQAIVRLEIFFFDTLNTEIYPRSYVFYIVSDWIKSEHVLETEVAGFVRTLLPYSGDRTC